MYEAHLVGIYTPEELPEQLQGFVNFQAVRDEHEIRPGERIAMFNVVGTASYVAVFLSDLCCYDDLEVKLSQHGVQADQVSRTSLQRVLEEMASRKTP
ncbi:MAG: DUF749 family protein [Methanomassiliicoccales archaeon]|nr:DUF749 family protein [Methanomassiliicoccales archaeon]